MSNIETVKHIHEAFGRGDIPAIHLLAVPRKADAMARALKDTRRRFASYWNALHHSTGHVWQGLYYSVLWMNPTWREMR